MEWFILSLLTAFAAATQDACVKKWFSHTSTYEMALFPLLFSLPAFLLILSFVQQPALDGTFWWSLAACLPFDGVAFLIYMEAIRIAPLSLTVPYLAFTPVFMLVTGKLVLQEVPNAAGMAGILVTVAGGYILNADPADTGLLAPFKNILKVKGSWMMCLVAFLYAFASVFGKQAVLHSSPIFFACVYYIIFSLALLIILFLLRKVSILSIRRNWRLGALAGLILLAHALLHNSAIALVKASYMISVKRLNVLFGVLYGGILFKESHIARRLVGALLMVGGAVMITLWGN